MSNPPLPPDATGHRLTEVLSLVGPLYRKCQRLVEDSESIEGVSIGVRAVLDMLRVHGPLTVPQMAREQSLSRQFVQRMTNDALASGWVRTTPNPAHKRSSLIELTTAGRRRITAVADREHASLSSVGGDLTGGDIDSCVRVLTSMLRHLEGFSVD